MTSSGYSERSKRSMASKTPWRPPQSWPSGLPGRRPSAKATSAPPSSSPAGCSIATTRTRQSYCPQTIAQPPTCSCEQRPARTPRTSSSDSSSPADRIHARQNAPSRGPSSGRRAAPTRRSAWPSTGRRRGGGEQITQRALGVVQADQALRRGVVFGRSRPLLAASQAVPEPRWSCMSMQRDCVSVSVPCGVGGRSCGYARAARCRKRRRWTRRASQLTQTAGPNYLPARHTGVVVRRERPTRSVGGGTLSAGCERRR